MEQQGKRSSSEHAVEVKEAAPQENLLSTDAVAESCDPKTGEVTKRGEDKAEAPGQVTPQDKAAAGSSSTTTATNDAAAVSPSAEDTKADDSEPVPLETRAAQPAAVEEAAPAAAATPRMSYAAMWEQSRPQESPTIRIVTALVGFGAVLILSIPCLYAWSLLKIPSLAVGGLEDVLQENQEQHQRETWLDNMVNAPRAQLWDPASALNDPASAVGTETDMPPPSPSRVVSGDSIAKPTAVKRAVKASRVAALPPPSEVAPPAPGGFEELWGSGADYQKSVAAPSSRIAPSSGSRDGKTADARGAELRARLKYRIASDPTGAPAVVLLSESVKIGGKTLPQGTRIEGQVTGAGGEDTRIFVSFTMAHLPKTSEAVPIVGVALDTSGRMGIPGKKELTREAAKSSGLAGAIAGLQQGASEVGGSIGGALGAALSGAAGAAGSKAKRADHDEYIVISEQGTPLIVYVQGFGAGGG